MLDCKHASRLVSQSMDRRLSLAERVGLRFHLLLCDACSNFSRQLVLLREAIRRMVRQTENDGAIRLSEPARERISKKLGKSE
jgi:hypothetical protein